MNTDPPRLFESDPAAREAIDAARSDVPDGKRLAKIGAAAAAAATVTGAATASAGTALATKIVIGVVFVGAVVGVGGYVVSSKNEPAPSASVAVTVTASVPATASVAASVSVAATASVSASASASAPVPFPTFGENVDEMELLDRAQKALATDPAASLSLCDKDAVANPKGTMAQEREVIAIDALMRLKKPDDAQKRAAKFHATWPDSAHGRRVDALLNLH